MTRATQASEDLLNRVVEGDATPAERAKLEALLAADPELRRRHDELKQAFQALGAARTEPVPDGLHDDIVGAVARAAAAVPARSTLAPAPRLRWTRLLLPISAAAAAVVLIFALRSPTLPPSASTSGTMGGSPQPTRLRLGTGLDEVEVTGLSTGQGFQIDVRAGASAGTVELTADGSLFRNRSVAGERSTTSTLRHGFRAGERWTAFGWATSNKIPVRVVVRYPDGRQATGQLLLARGSP